MPLDPVFSDIRPPKKVFDESDPAFLEKDHEGLLMIGPYCVSKTLGKGTYATVKMGTHCVTGQHVAIKFISKKLVADHPALMVRIQREVAILKMIDHPNVVRLIDFLETDSFLVIVMEFVSGGDLYEFLDRRIHQLKKRLAIASPSTNEGRNGGQLGLTADEAFPLFYQLVCGLEYCHCHSVAHRDIKPENVLMDSCHKVVKLTDFGMANMKKQMTETMCGTPQYCAPEILRREKYDGKIADIWSLGVLLYVLCTARLPFSDTEIRALVQQPKGVEARFMIPKYLGRHLRELLQSMIQMDPKKRPTIFQIKMHPWWLMQCAALNLDPVGQSVFSASHSSSFLGLTLSTVSSHPQPRVSLDMPSPSVFPPSDSLDNLSASFTSISGSGARTVKASAGAVVEKGGSPTLAAADNPLLTKKPIIPTSLVYESEDDWKPRSPSPLSNAVEEAQHRISIESSCTTMAATPSPRASKLSEALRPSKVSVVPQKTPHRAWTAIRRLFASCKPSKL